MTLNPEAYENIGLTWDELRLAMRYGDEIAAMIDSKIATYKMIVLEAEHILRDLKERNSLPDKKKLFTVLHDDYGVNLKKTEKLSFLSKFY